MGIFSREPRSYVSILSGVRGSLTAQHRSRWGDVHEHTWEITVWFKSADRGIVDATHVKKQLDETLLNYSGKCLPDRIAWAEHLAGEIASQMACQWDSHVVVRVNIERRREGLLVEWSRT